MITQKQVLGASVNEVKQKMEVMLAEKKDTVQEQELQAQMESERFELKHSIALLRITIT